MGYTLDIGKIRRSLDHAIENVYYVSGLKYSLLNVSQIYDKGSKVKFLFDWCIVTSLQFSGVTLRVK